MELPCHGGPCDGQSVELSRPVPSVNMLLPSGTHAIYKPSLHYKEEEDGTVKPETKGQWVLLFSHVE